jgi:hypothetical protein
MRLNRREFLKAMGVIGGSAVEAGASGGNPYEVISKSIDQWASGRLDTVKMVPVEGSVAQLEKDYDKLYPMIKKGLERGRISFEQRAVEIKGYRFLLNTFESEGLDPQSLGESRNCFFVPHDNEDAALASGLEYIRSRGGKIFALENNEQRNLYDRKKNRSTGVDPNRIFRLDNSFYLLGLKIMKEMIEKKPNMILTLHNNLESGGFNVDTMRSKGVVEVLVENDPNRNNMIWLAGNKPYDQIPAIKNQVQHYERLRDYDPKLRKEVGLNVVYEQTSRLDKSMSTLCGQNGIVYCNIETGVAKKGTFEYEEMVRQLKYISLVQEFTQFNSIAGNYS